VNDPATHSFIAQYDLLTANTWTEIVIPIPVPPSGTWSVDNTIGMRLEFPFGMGPNYQGVLGWQSGNLFFAPGTVNGASGPGAIHLADVGLYVDTDNTGVPPKYEVPDEAAVLLSCQRYWKRFSSFIVAGYSTAGGNIYGAMPISPEMRIAPAVVITTPSYSNASNYMLNSVTTHSFQVRVTGTAAGMMFGQANGTFNARP
jgi:hypothetical protein